MTDRLIKPMTKDEIDRLVRSYSDERLRDNFTHASDAPRTSWYVILLAEMQRRGLQVKAAGDD